MREKIIENLLPICIPGTSVRVAFEQTGMEDDWAMLKAVTHEGKERYCGNLFSIDPLGLTMFSGIDRGLELDGLSRIPGTGKMKLSKTSVLQNTVAKKKILRTESVVILPRTEHYLALIQTTSELSIRVTDSAGAPKPNGCLLLLANTGIRLMKGISNSLGLELDDNGCLRCGDF